MELADVRCGVCGWTTGCECEATLPCGHPAADLTSDGTSNFCAVCAVLPSPDRPCDEDDCPYIATGFDAWGYWCSEHSGGRA